MKTSIIVKGLVLVAGFALIGLATYFTKDANCLWAIILIGLITKYL